MAVILGGLGVLLACKGANRTQTILNRSPGTDKVIGAMAWIDRSVFRAKSSDP
jgi:hypothetical protein